MARHTNAHSQDVTQLEMPPTPARSRTTAQLTVLAGADVGQVFPLTLPVVTLGRATEAEVRLASKSISRAHARIHRIADDLYELEDLGSSNGTLVNDQPLFGRRAIRSGDRIRLGPRILLHFATVDQFDLQLRELERLETVSRLSAAVNHDLNNLLSVLTCSVAYLAGLEPSTPMSTPDVIECLHDMQLAAKKAGELTQGLNTLVRQNGQAASEHVDLSELSDEVVRMLKRILPSGIRLETQIERDLWLVGDRTSIHQLLMNPCINARDAMGGAGTLRIHARHAWPSELAQHPDLEPGPHLLISIMDTGHGVPPELLSRVFEPFFTTKGAGKGTGLGLATVARVAKEHGGAVYLTSERGLGTNVRIFLPKKAYGMGRHATA